MPPPAIAVFRNALIPMVFTKAGMVTAPVRFLQMSNAPPPMLVRTLPLPNVSEVIAVPLNAFTPMD
jgi:hypothetical protein